MALIVQKYGGSSLKTAEDIKNVAERITKLYRKKNKVIVVVSAMGNTTNELHDLAKKVSPQPWQRELDMLLTTGERISMSLLSMALNDRKVPAISFTGSQAGVLTNDSHNNAQIVDIRPFRIEESLNENKVVVLAGFQGVSATKKEITTLGRGGSDTTAVAMAAHFKALRCEILKDVDGIFSADPKIVRKARLLSKVSYQHLIDMTFWGAKFLHHRAAELAYRLQVPIYIGPSHIIGKGTTVQGEEAMYENEKVLSVNSHSYVRKVSTNKKNISDALNLFFKELNQNQIPILQILDSHQGAKGWEILVTGPKENISSLNSSFKNNKSITLVSKNYSSVTATLTGLVGSDTSARLSAKLQNKKIAVEKIIYTPMSITFVIPEDQREEAILSLHQN